MNRTSNQLIGAVATWHGIHVSLMKLGLSCDDISRDKVIKERFSSTSSTSSSYSTDSFISYIGDDCMSKHDIYNINILLKFLINTPLEIANDP